MADLPTRIVVDLGFDRALGALIHAVRDEGLEVIASVDVREHFRRTVRREFRQYALLQVWSSDLAFEALKRDLPAATVVPTTLAIYELADGETAIVAHQPPLPAAGKAGWGGERGGLGPLAAQQRDRISRVLARLRHVPRRQPAIPHAA